MSHSSSNQPVCVDQTPWTRDDVIQLLNRLSTIITILENYYADQMQMDRPSANVEDEIPF